ncbi:MAG: succinate dehydrogenase/fumarate reductase iron-sulfur subunit [Myxococcales bacterium]|nr:succinate dehydrogenase/fumarate reductase iron-sulfur subunit [Myxococcales bacterium]
MSKIRLNLKIWRQRSAKAPGEFVDYPVDWVEGDMSFLEMLDLLNDRLSAKGEDIVAFDYDCREGICGSCGMVINGVPHGPMPGTTTCQLFMRHFQSGDTIIVEPWRSRAFPVVKDLVVDRNALDRLVQTGGYVSVNCGSARDANEILIGKEDADKAFDFAACIGCGACIAACKNSAAHLFVGAKVSQLALLPQGKVERARRVLRMVDQMIAEGFGACSNEGECEAVCPKSISTEAIAMLNREYLKATLIRI